MPQSLWKDWRPQSLRIFNLDPVLKPFIILENPKFSGNIGMICRLAANFDIGPVRIIGTKKEEDIFEMEWMAHNAEEEMQRIQYAASLEECRDSAELIVGTAMIHGRDRGRFISLARLKEIAKKFHTGILFGREDKGLKRETAIKCDYLVDFRLPGKQKSMNLASSVSYVLGALFGTEETAFYKTRELNLSRNRLYEKAEEFFRGLGMDSYHGSENLPVQRLKKILDKADMTQGDMDFFFRIFEAFRYTKKLE